MSYAKSKCFSNQTITRFKIEELQYSMKRINFEGQQNKNIEFQLTLLSFSVKVRPKYMSYWCQASKVPNWALINKEVYYIQVMFFVPRPHTCPSQPEQTPIMSKQHFKNLFGENSSSTSLTAIQKQQDQQINTKKSLKDTKRGITTRLSLQSLREIQFQKDLNQNRYTINLAESQKRSSLPRISGLCNIRQTLVSEEAFEHYKRVNATNGHYQQALKQLQKVEQQKIYKLKLQNRMKIKTRKNIFQMQKNDTIEDIYDLFIFANNRKISKDQKEIDPLVKNIDKILKPMKKASKTSTKLDCKWKLGDFFDPIICDQNQDFGRTQNVRRRLSFLGKIQKITSACDDIEDQSKTKTYLNLFSKYSEKLSTNLRKKTKKLDKVRMVFRD